MWARIFHVWNLQEQVIGIVSNRFGDGHTILSARHKEGNHTLRMMIDAGDEKAELFQMGHLVGFYDNDQKYQQFEIKDVNLTAAAASTLEIYAEHVKYELTKEPLTDIRPTRTSVGQAVSQGLTKTRWQLGDMVDAGNESMRGYYTDVLSYLVKAQDTWSVEMEYELAVERNVIAHRRVNVLTRRGAFRGRRFEYTKDTQSIKGYFSAADIETALIVRGRGVETGETADGDATYGRRLLIDGVEWRKANGDPLDKPLGDIYIEDPEAKARWGFAGGTRNRFGFVVFEQIEDAQELLQAGYEELQVRKEPSYSYTLEVDDLETTEGPHEAVRMGDTVYVIHRAVKPAVELEARVIDIDRDLLCDEDTGLELGDARSQISDKLLSTAKLAEKAQGINDNGTFPTDHLSGIINVLKNQLVASGSFAQAEVLRNQGFLLENTDRTSSDYGALYLGPGIFAIANAKENGEWKWRTFGKGSGFTADLVTAGVFDGGLVKFQGSGTYMDGTKMVIKHPGIGANADTSIGENGLSMRDASGNVVAGLLRDAATGKVSLAANAIINLLINTAFSVDIGYVPAWEGAVGLQINADNERLGIIGGGGQYGGAGQMTVHCFAGDLWFGDGYGNMITLRQLLARIPDD